MSSNSVQEALGLTSSLDPQLACVGARGWGKLEEVCEVCVERVVESGKGEGVEVRVWAVKVMSEVVKTCSDAQLAQNCHRWRATLVAALQSCSSGVALRGVCQAVAALVGRAHRSPAAVRDFSATSLPPLLSPLLRFQDSAPFLQATVLSCLSTIHHLYPSSCRPHRPILLKWGKEGLLHSDLTLSRESARLLVVMHSSPDQWTPLLTSSLSTLSSSLLHLSHTLTRATPPSDKLNLDLPPSEPECSAHLLRLITSRSRLLCYLLLSPPPSPLTTPLSTLVGVVSLGLHINSEQIVTMATNSTILLTILPAVHSSLLILLCSLITSSHSHLLPYTSTIDATLLCQLGNKGGVAWGGSVNIALCAWVKVRGEGGKGDRFSAAVVQWLLQSCQSEDDGIVGQALKILCVVMSRCRASMPSHTAQRVWHAAQTILTRHSSVTVVLAGVRLLRVCLEYPDSTPLSVAIRIFQSHTYHSSDEVCDESRHGLATCSLLLHPLGPPWCTGSASIEQSPLRGANASIGPLSESVDFGHHVTTSECDSAAPSTSGGIGVQPTSNPAGANFQPVSNPLGGKSTQVPELQGAVDLSTGSRKRRREEGGVVPAGLAGPLTEASPGTRGAWASQEKEGARDRETEHEDGRKIPVREVEEGGCVEPVRVCSEEVEVCGGPGEVCGEDVAEAQCMLEEGGGVREEREDSDVEDILATFYSSPSSSECST